MPFIYIKLKSQKANSHAGDGEQLDCSPICPGAVWKKRGCNLAPSTILTKTSKRGGCHVLMFVTCPQVGDVSYQGHKQRGQADRRSTDCTYRRQFNKNSIKKTDKLQRHFFLKISFLKVMKFQWYFSCLMHFFFLYKYVGGFLNFCLDKTWNDWRKVGGCRSGLLSLKLQGIKVSFHAGKETGQGFMVHICHYVHVAKILLALKKRQNNNYEENILFCFDDTCILTLVLSAAWFPVTVCCCLILGMRNVKLNFQSSFRWRLIFKKYRKRLN